MTVLELPSVPVPENHHRLVAPRPLVIVGFEVMAPGLGVPLEGLDVDLTVRVGAFVAFGCVPLGFVRDRIEWPWNGGEGLEVYLESPWVCRVFVRVRDADEALWPRITLRGTRGLEKQDPDDESGGRSDLP